MKSNASDYLELVCAIYIDAANKCIADVSDLRDLETIKSRVKDEGFSFLTITLPQFCNYFERSLAVGYIDSTSFPGFKRRNDGPIPVFLQGMVSQIFDSETGRLRKKHEPPFNNGRFDSEISTIVEGVRQICLAFKKVEIPCTPKRVQDSLRSFVSIEQSLEMFSAPQEVRSDFIGVASLLWDNLMVDLSISDCTPRHGPGATAERISGNQKYNWQRWHQRLEPYFPVVDSAYPLGISEDLQALKLLTLVSGTDEQSVRVVQVPKTLKSPRIIAIEPCCMQYTQQGIRDLLYASLESYWLTSGRINFSDQSTNQRLALTQSREGLFATIDLSDASDRVPRDLALDMFNGNPDLRDAIDACRSTTAQLPNGIVISPLRKFASMGSALCFPVEAMYFYTICVVALLKDRGLPRSLENIYLVTRDIYVYGDDIIVPSTNAIAVLEHLQKYNCKVNSNKTFWTGKFRESCGVDAYDGMEVTPTYIRHEIPENRQQARRVISWVKTANFFYKKGYWRTSSLMFQKLEKVVGNIPYLPESSPGLGRISYLGHRIQHAWNVKSSKMRWNPELHRFEIKALVPSPVYRDDKLEGYGALQKSLSTLTRKPQGIREFVEEERRRSFQWKDDQTVIPIDADKRHLERTALHGAVTLKLR